MQDQLKRIVNLVNKTGDKVVVYNELEPESSYVVMGLDAYEELAVPFEIEEIEQGLTDDEYVDKINRDIADWKSDDPEIENDDLIDEFVDESPSTKTKSWRIPEEVKEAADEVIEEDRQYLEEISF